MTHSLCEVYQLDQCVLWADLQKQAVESIRKDPL